MPTVDVLAQTQTEIALRLALWLAPLDQASLECDGFTRAVSTLLRRDGVPHAILCGAFEVVGVGRIGYHWWIEFPWGDVCDFRARMWLGNHGSVPHGVFAPTPVHRYLPTAQFGDRSFGPGVFELMTGCRLEQFEPFALSTGVAAAI